MSAEWERAARSSVASKRSGRSPCAARVWLTALSRPLSVRVSEAAEAAEATANATKPAAKAARTFFFISIPAACQAGRTAGIPRSGDPRGSAGRLGDRDADEHDGSARELDRGQGLAEPGPGDERPRHGLEHRDDADAGGADVAQRADDQDERHDRPDHDHPGDEGGHRKVHAAE